MKHVGRVKARLFLMLAATLPAATRAQPPRAADGPGVTGYVLSTDGTPVSAGSVIARSDAGSTTVAIDGHGRFRFAPARGGVHHLLVSAPGSAPFRVSVAVPPSRSLQLPVIRLAPATYFRVRLVSPPGDPIATPQIRRLSFDPGGKLLSGPLGDRGLDAPDAAGAVAIGPLLRGVTVVAVDMPGFAQTRLADLTVGDQSGTIDGGTIVIQQPGAVLRVQVVDEGGAPVPDHYVEIEDVRPRSPLVFRPARTDSHGYVTFDRLAAGRYRLRTAAARRCGNVLLTAAQLVAVPGAGTLETRVIAGGTAALRFASPLGPSAGLTVWASPAVPPPSSLLRSSVATPTCFGVTDADGRVTFDNFPPGPARVDLRMTNSTYERQIDVPSDGREIAVAIPEGLLPVRVVNAVTGQPIAAARIVWTGGGGRVEAASTATGDALLEAVGNAGGTLGVTAQGFDPATEVITELPGIPHVVGLAPVAGATTLSVRVRGASGESLRGAVVEILSADASEIARVAVTDASGAATFRDVSPGAVRILAGADGFATSIVAFEPQGGEAAITLVRGYRVLVGVELPAGAGTQAVRVLNDGGASMEPALDGDSDRRVDPSGRVSIGPLAPGTYVLELTGAAGRRQEHVRIVDRDISVTIR